MRFEGVRNLFNFTLFIGLHEFICLQIWWNKFSGIL